MKKLLMLVALVGLVVPATFPEKAYGADEKQDTKSEKKKKKKTSKKKSDTKEDQKAAM